LDPARTAERVIVRKVRWKMPLQGFFGLRLVMNSNVSPLKNFKLFNAEQKQGLGAGTLGIGAPPAGSSSLWSAVIGSPVGAYQASRGREKPAAQA